MQNMKPRRRLCFTRLIGAPANFGDDERMIVGLQVADGCETQPKISLRNIKLALLR
jgi:hypothetical protein